MLLIESCKFALEVCIHLEGDTGCTEDNLEEHPHLKVRCCFSRSPRLIAPIHTKWQVLVAGYHGRVSLYLGFCHQHSCCISSPSQAVFCAWCHTWPQRKVWASFEFLLFYIRLLGSISWSVAPIIGPQQPGSLPSTLVIFRCVEHVSEKWFVGLGSRLGPVP